MDIDENAPGNRSQQAVTRTTDNETSVEQDMTDVDSNNSVSSEHPPAGNTARNDAPDADAKINDPGENTREPRGVPASDPESGA
ncbi:MULTISPECIES: hypothetical protein [Pseudomonas]|uniref:Uncharacterized protein n=1 Tax=Pseudomonas fluorescens TaxID=294 RepID=A0A5E6TV13_PSEFL|nr:MULTISPECIES: hypothetical protein [Pseudomonas]VVM97199.1 hypothetical protein PS652_03100 [Pseudomonas fluorescens]